MKRAIIVDLLLVLGACAFIMGGVLMGFLLYGEPGAVGAGYGCCGMFVAGACIWIHESRVRGRERLAEAESPACRELRTKLATATIGLAGIRHAVRRALEADLDKLDPEYARGLRAIHETTKKLLDAVKS